MNDCYKIDSKTLMLVRVLNNLNIIEYSVSIRYYIGNYAENELRWVIDK